MEIASRIIFTMMHLFPWQFLVFAFILIILTWFFSRKKPLQEYQYKIKEFFMTRSEHDLFDVLVSAVGERYHVFPQVHLENFIEHKIPGQTWTYALRHINQKSVDFVLCDKVYIKPILSIELDDRTHERADRIKRDKIVEGILHEAGMPLLRILNRGSLDKAWVIQQLSQLLPP